MGRHLTGTLQMAKQDIQSHNMSLPTVTTQLFKPKITVYIYIYIYIYIPNTHGAGNQRT
jgi:hypothetical protein